MLKLVILLLCVFSIRKTHFHGVVRYRRQDLRHGTIQPFLYTSALFSHLTASRFNRLCRLHYAILDSTGELIPQALRTAYAESGGFHLLCRRPRAEVGFLCQQAGIYGGSTYPLAMNGPEKREQINKISSVACINPSL